MTARSEKSDKAPEGSVDRDAGMVFSIQRFSLQDGPGIRTTVFLKGCPLRCNWCSNPESQNPSPELMWRRPNCQACGTCADVCETGAIRCDEGAPIIDRQLCAACSLCVDACPGNALEISGMKMAVQDVVDEVLKDIPFYENSGGGVTVSGGEPLFQSDFTHNLLKECKSKGLHTCLDTSGHGSWDALNRILDHTDLVLFDIKHFDEELHLKATGMSNELILENFRKLMDSGKTEVWVRIPVIPGFNEADTFFADLAESLHGSTMEKVSLLGYHEWGKTKYNALGKAYPLNGTEACSTERLESIKVYLEKHGIKAAIDH
jgi:pyruvate formate lyase activating enzyme